MSTPGGPRQPNSGDAERWAPFPVQDWSTLPSPECGDDPYAYVDPAWEPPSEPAQQQRISRGRPPWLPLLVVIMVTALMAGGLFAAERVGSAATVTAALAYVPGDGQVAYQQRETAVGAQSTLTRLVTESARPSGAGLISGLDWTLSLAVGRVTGFDHLDRMRFWRTTGTEIGTMGSSQQLIRVYRVDAAIELVAESGPGSADVYTPALVELPATASPGDSWHSEGTVGSRHYRSDLQAAAVEPGCLQVTGRVAEQTSDGQPGPTRTMDKTWCRSRGVVAEKTTRGDVTTRVEAVAQPSADPTLRTAHEPWDWSDPTAWRRRDFDLISADASLGSGPMAGAPSQAGAVVAASGLLIRTTSGDDLVATTPKTIDRWTSLWRMHPGGTVLSLAAFGDVVVATTSRREAVAYSDAGIRLWTLPLDDVAFWSPARVDAERVAIADASGTVRVVEVLTGRQLWQQRVTAQVSGPVVGDSRAVVVLDAGGSVTAFDAGTGDERWSRDLSSTTGAVLGDLVVISNAATLEALDLVSGRHRWLLPTTGTLDALVPLGDTLLAATQLGTQVIDVDGTVLERLPAYESVSVVGDTMVGWGRTEAEFRDLHRALLHTIDTPDRSLRSTVLKPLAYRQGVIVFGPNWTFSTWSDEP